MAGHSKWANIKHRKAAQDSKRGKIFTKLIREITVSAKMGGADADSNPRLRAAIQAALAQNMTRDTVDRAIKRGAGSDNDGQLDEIRYEGYAPGGVAVMVDCMTDNKNRTVSEVRHVFSKAGGSLGTDGSVAYMFTKLGILIYHNVYDEEALMEASLEAGADDFQTLDSGEYEVITSPDVFLNVKETLEKQNYISEFSEVSMEAEVKIEMTDERREKVMKMLDKLEDLDDVQNVYTNADL